MKTLIFNKEEFKADKIIKTEDNIVGKNAKGIEVFSFRGIKDFSLFKLEDGQEYDTEVTDEQQLLSIVLLENADIKEQLKEQQELSANLALQIAELKGGNLNVQVG